MSDEFTSVKQLIKCWEPKQTGNKKDGNLTPLKATDNSYLIGYYLESRENIGKEKNSTMHILQLESCGSKNALPEDIKKEDKVGVWGTGVLNDMITNNVSPGQFIKITWLGKQTPKNQGGNEYHGWDVGVSEKREPINLGGSIEIPAKNVSTESKPEVAGNQDDSDDLPF